MGPAKVVVSYRNGTTRKGYTYNFDPNRAFFHLQTEQGAVEVSLADLKAVFFVKTFDGDPGRPDRRDFQGGERLIGRRVRVRFGDGEIIPGTTLSYHPARPGFFLIPADPSSNNERIFVPAAAARIMAD